MKALKLDPTTHDLAFVNNGLVTVTDAACVAQRVKQHLRSFLGEWFLDTTAGVPWHEYIFAEPYDAATAEAVIKDAVAAVPGVTEIVSFGMNYVPARRQVNVYEMSVRTIYDEVINVYA